ncbi:MAG: sugar ABC transporter permease [Chloroflexi bacterium]|nr:sugar ABC transporter permease [Chloroflexota bacterium]MDL1884998.1 sugar ABC transporter permease [Anaerolineae bacterium CFX8]
MAAVPRQISRRRRILTENLTAYAFLFPAGLLIFLFGIFPVAFAFFVSLHRWRRFPDEYVGLANYERALGDFAYALFFYAGAAAIAAGLYLARRVLRGARPWNETAAAVLAGAANTAAILLFTRWFFTLLPVILNIPVRLRGQERVQGLFVSELFASFRFPEVMSAWFPSLAAVLAAVVVSYGAVRLARRDETIGRRLWLATGAGLLLALGALALNLTLEAIGAAAEAAQAEGAELPIWSQIVVISLGMAAVVAAYQVWTRAARRWGDRQLVVSLAAAALLLVGGYALVTEVPRLLAAADRNMMSGFSVTIMYAAGAVPFQLMIGLGLAYLLFQKIRGTTAFRMVFFLPYIMPFVATSMVFSLLFSHRQDSLANHLIGAFGIPPQKWLLEPTGIFQLIFGPQIPSWLAGPGLALVVIIIYTVWTYSGYATVVFLAGLGNISGELYEAARIDGASGWQIFRNITLPLLSPTTFFLMLVATIGTFQAFTQIWMMRTPAAARAVDNMSIYIFERITDASPNYGYGSALAFVLFFVILILTVTQNRIAGRRVFYG